MSTEWTAEKIRQTFIDYHVQQHAHTFVPSSSTIPYEDPSLLFANAGMNQFKAIFLGTVDPNTDFGKLKRAVNSQKCIRAGGKHNDLDDVGKDLYHHTFFEMLGNWSFGDYFKKEAIDQAWDLLTRVYGLSPDRLYVSYFGGNEELNVPADFEARDHWLSKGIPPNRVLPFGMKENFWEMGETGPCGPCSEIHYDRIGGREVPHLVNQDDPNVLEIWNLVFIQFNREKDRSLKPLPAKSVDTGMGLERITSVLQNKMSNYDTDLFTYLFDAIQKGTGARPYSGKIGADDVDGIDMAYRVLADHARTLTFAMADGGVPDKDSRGYVLRRILRRAVRYGHEKLKAPPGFFATLVTEIVNYMGSFFPELKRDPKSLQEIINEEELQFRRTLERGIRLFQGYAEKASANETKVISGQDAFLLYDTYGFPKDLTQLMAEERGLKINLEEYNEAENRAKEASKALKEGAAASVVLDVHAIGELNDRGIKPTEDSAKYTDLVSTGKVLAIYSKNEFVDHIVAQPSPELFGLILDRTNFYAEQGGQIYDLGTIEIEDQVEMAVESVQVYGGFVLHVGFLKHGSLKIGDSVTCAIDEMRRRPIRRNHTATHLLNFGLRSTLGDGIDQKGSLVAPDRLRFDFSFKKPVATEELQKIENIVQDQVKKNLPVFAKESNLTQARSVNGLRAVFGEVYPDPVRIVSVGFDVDDLLKDPTNKKWLDGSIEFCGGTHVAQTGDIGGFSILSEEAVAKGVRRIVAVSGTEARKAVEEAERFDKKLKEISVLQGRALNAAVIEATKELDESAIPIVRKEEFRSRLAALKKIFDDADKAAKAVALEQATELIKNLVLSKPDQLFYVEVVNVGGNSKSLISIQRQFPSTSAAAVFSVDEENQKVIYASLVPQNLIKRGLNAKEWAESIAAILGGKAGGNEKTAQGTGTHVDLLEKAKEAAIQFATQKLA